MIGVKPFFPYKLRVPPAVRSSHTSAGHCIMKALAHAMCVFWPFCAARRAILIYDTFKPTYNTADNHKESRR